MESSTVLGINTRNDDFLISVTEMKAMKEIIDMSSPLKTGV